VSALTDILHFFHLLSYYQEVSLRAGKITPDVYPLLRLPFRVYSPLLLTSVP
jgi:hypothetical protein